MPMAQEPDVPTQVYHALTERLQNNDKDGAIELYYELLSSGHSVGEILNGIDTVRSTAEPGTAAIAEHSRSRPEGTAIDPAGEVALAEMAPATVYGTSVPSIPYSPYDTDNVERGGTEKPQAAEAAPLDAFGQDHGEGRWRESLPDAAPDIFGPSGADASEDANATSHTDNRERRWSGSFPGIAKSIGFWALYTGAIAAASIAGFSILHREHGTEATIARAQPGGSGSNESGLAALPGAAGNRSDAIAEQLNPGKPAAGDKAPQTPEPSTPGAPGSAASGAVPGRLQPVAASVPETVSAPRREADAQQRPNAGRRDRVEQLIEQLNLATVTPPEAAHEPTPPLAQSSPTGAVEATPHPDTEPPKAGDKPEAAAKDEARAVSEPATMPGSDASASPASRARVAKRHGAKTTRPSAEARRHVRRHTPRAHAPSAYAGQSSGSYHTALGAGPYGTDAARRYGHGAYGPAPYADTGD